MLDEKEIKRVMELALSHSKADQTEVSLFVTDSALTRFANNYIHQNVAERDTNLLVRAIFGTKIGIASVNSVEEEAVRQGVERATELARFQVDNPDFRSLPGPQPVKAVSSYISRTARCSAQERAAAVDVICKKAKEKGLVAAGAFSTETSQVAVANSMGVFAHHTGTLANISTVIMSGDGSGYADLITADVSKVDPDAIAQEAIDKAVRSHNPISLEPGEYEVILEEYAVSDILDFLAYLGFSALAVQEGRSFMAGRLGQKVLGNNITIWDEGCGEGTIPMPFDFEGVHKDRLDIIEGGIAKAICYDSYTAGREGKASTGHALPAGDTFGPMPMNLFLKAGTATKEEMLASTKRGIWVTRFWYTRMVHPLTIHVTGTTRDGTFLIENGEVVAPVRNLRFTQSYLEALNNVEMVGKQTRLEQTMFPYNLVPALKISRWNFTGVTQF